MGSTNNLPSGWNKAKLKDVAQINLRSPIIHKLPDDLEVTFLPMAGVDAARGAIVEPQIRFLSEVRKGYTPFNDGDVFDQAFGTVQTVTDASP